MKKRPNVKKRFESGGGLADTCNLGLLEKRCYLISSRYPCRLVMTDPGVGINQHLLSLLFDFVLLPSSAVKPEGIKS